MQTPLRIYHLDLKVAMFQVSWLKRWFERLRDAGSERKFAPQVPPPLDADNRCVRCRRIVVGLKPGDLHDHTERCPDCGRERETL